MLLGLAKTVPVQRVHLVSHVSREVGPGFQVPYMKLSIPRNSRSTRRAFTSCLLSFSILLMPFAQIATGRGTSPTARRGTSPTVREGSSSTNQKSNTAKDLFVNPDPVVGTTLTTTLTGVITP